MQRIRLFGVLVLGLLALTISGLSGCGTIEGFGRDVQKGGEAVEEAADRNDGN
ncbi:entericidin A/B family lipoprotein [Thioalkalivibrio sp.]|uniref:entericidin A/B family lipoprotein n=1 Tax=Thioalkalivibrio sp. TaxID=2093813 RepID=UPI00356A65D2